MAERKVEAHQEEADSQIENRRLMVELMEQKATISEENARLQQQLQDQASVFAQERTRLQEEMSSETEAKKFAVRSADEFKENATNLAKSLEIAQVQIVQLTAERDTYKRQVEKATGIIVKLNAKKQALETDLNQSRDLNTTLDSDLQAQTAQLTAERDAYKTRTEMATGIIEKLNTKKKALEAGLNQSRSELDDVRRLLNSSLVNELDRHNDSSDLECAAEEAQRASVVLQAGHEMPAEVRQLSALVLDELRQRGSNSEPNDDDEVVHHPSPRDAVSRQAIVKSNDSFFSGVTTFASKNKALTTVAAAGIGVAAIAIKSLF